MKAKIQEESVEHLVTVLSCMLEGESDDIKIRTEMFNKSVEYVKEWVMYRLPKKLLK